MVLTAHQCILILLTLTLGGIRSLSVLSFLPSIPFVLLRSRPPLRLKGLGERISSPSGSGRSPSPNVFWCIFGINLHPFDCLMRIISCVYCPLKECFRDIFAIYCRGRKRWWKTNLKHTIWQPFGGIFWGDPAKKMPEINTAAHSYTSCWQELLLLSDARGTNS